jgi:Ca2+-binding EF-hand superfamily protein
MEATALMDYYDTDADGVITYYEFLHNIMQETEVNLQDTNAHRRVQAY